MPEQREYICTKKHPGMHEIAPFFKFFCPKPPPIYRSLVPSKLNFAAPVEIRICKGPFSLIVRIWPFIFSKTFFRNCDDNSGMPPNYVPEVTLRNTANKWASFWKNGTKCMSVIKNTKKTIHQLRINETKFAWIRTRSRGRMALCMYKIDQLQKVSIHVSLPGMFANTLNLTYPENDAYRNNLLRKSVHH